MTDPLRRATGIHPMRVYSLLVLLTALPCPAIQTAVMAQFDAGRSLAPINLPTTIINQSITAQGDFIRANANAYRDYQLGNVYYAEARQRLAEAVSMELDNYKKRVEIYFDRRLLNEQKKMELLEVIDQRRDQTVELRDNARQRLINRILSDRERNTGAIESGLALNKLLYALAETPVAFDVDLGPAVQSQIDQRLSLAVSTLTAMKIQTPGDQKQQLSLMQPTGLDLTWWPDHLRQESYDDLREGLTQSLDAINDSVAGGLPVHRDQVGALKDSIARVSQKYYADYPPSRKKAMSTDELYQYLRTDEFFVRLNRDIQRIRDTGRGEALGSAEPFDPDKHGRNAQTLVTWMLQNGLKFGPAGQGDEAHYHQMFSKVADLLTMVTN